MPLNKLRARQKGLNLYARMRGRSNTEENARMMERSNTEENARMMEALYYMGKQSHS